MVDGNARAGPEIALKRPVALRHDLSQRQIDILLAGGIINWLRAHLGSQAASAPRQETAALVNPG
ncbi:MAG TPA: hypothetical protein VJY39_16660 [Acidisphaera sp.]|nr:hypothetical protein [Acidisphaera sp.]